MGWELERWDGWAHGMQLCALAAWQLQLTPASTSSNTQPMPANTSPNNAVLALAHRLVPTEASKRFSRRARSLWLPANVVASSRRVV